ncbi:MAG: lysine--tRNA ligase [Deltaproteobacteria bacterium]|nr:lysine--tRNA ligase [Deltaproteobacteria bacterium]
MAGKEKPAASLEELKAHRARKRDELREAGVHPYSNTFRPEHHAQDVRNRCADALPSDPPSMDPVSEVRFRLAGRVMVLRSFGKAAFLDFEDVTGRIQVYVKKDVLPDEEFKTFKKVDVGDIVGVEGFAFFTKTGELTVMAERMHFITKALRPLAEKWHGLADPEVRFRQRYLDLVMNPELRQVFAVRGLVLRTLREYLDAQEFVEVETPMLHPIRGGANARPFTTHHNALDMNLFLRVAPELYLKRLLVGGFERVYEIGKCFRNEGVSKRHNPEFTMLEFYEAHTDYEGVLRRSEEMLRHVEQCVHERFAHLRAKRQFDLQGPWERMDMREAVVKHSGGLDRETIDDEVRLRDWYEEHTPVDMRVTGYGEMIFDLFERYAEPALGQGPTAILDFPAAVSPLSRPSDADPRWTERFEVYLAGREIINAFSELNDPSVQAERFGRQVQAHDGGDEEAMDFDHDYIRALEVGMPPAGGFGLGIDRLVMALCGLDSIREVILFPLLRPESK